MDIKWKSKGKVLFALFLISIGFAILMTSQSMGSELFKKTFFETATFENQKQAFIRELATHELFEPSKEDLKKRITVTDDEIEMHRTEYGTLEEQVASIQEQYRDRIASAEQLENKEVKDMLVKERDAKIKDITLNFQSDEYVRKKIIKQKEAELDEAFRSISQSGSQLDYYLKTFDYYLVDEESGKVYTSLVRDKDDYKAYFNQKNTVFTEQYGGSEPKLAIEESDMLSEWMIHIQDFAGSERSPAEFSGYIGIPKNAPADSEIMKAADHFRQIQIAYFALVILGAAALIRGGYLAVKIYPLRDGAFEWAPYSKIYTEIRWGAILFNLFVLWAVAQDQENLLSYVGDAGFFYVIETGFYNGLVMAALLFLLMVQSALSVNLAMNRGVEKEVTGHTFTFAFCRMVKRAFSGTNIGVQLIVVLALIFTSGGFAAAALYEGIMYGDRAFLLLIPVIAVADLFILFIVLRQMARFNTIVKAIEGITEGRNEPDIDSRGSSALAKLAANINQLKRGVKASYSSQEKSERLKTELITNVSHDLRTPLTSIITYTDLLKQPELSEEERNNYLAIIDRKSKRLKLLIDDLFEASKMATGDIELQKTKVDIVQLLQQALAEHDEKISETKLQFRFVHDETSLLAVVDGQKMWRVFDNLIGNILKYSLPGTRVYIGAKKKGPKIEISFKNISQFELGMNTDELFERFKRGDRSRHTEGSGLGLAIAKSIIDLHGGEMDIEADGDLFKVTLLIEEA